MNKPNADIELIRKYFNGELNPADQHELEKRALDDPFLRDAMDGFEEFAVKQKDLGKLENRLATRLEKKKKVLPIWGFKQWSIAASLIFGIAALSIYVNQTPENKTIAVSELQKQERLPKSVKILEDTLIKANESAVIDLIVNSPSVVQNSISTSLEVRAFSPADEITIESIDRINMPDKKDSIELIDETISGYAVQKKPETIGLVTKFKAEEFAKLNTASTFASRASGVSIAKNRIQKIEQVVGKVTAIKDGVALPGVQITNTKNGAVAITDGRGEFKITAEEKDELTANYIGFLTETFAVYKNDSLKIALKSNEESLSEVVVAGYGTKKSNEVFASPKGGWKEFRKYLDDNTVLNNEEKGRVIVQFIIQPDGKLSNFFIQKSLNSLANSKAIQLIKDYQPWFGSADGKSQKVKVVVRFK